VPVSRVLVFVVIGKVGDIDLSLVGGHKADVAVLLEIG
jgi:hypothetical protein